MANGNGGAVEVAAGYASIYADFDAAGLRAEIQSALSGLNPSFRVSANVASATKALDALSTTTGRWGTKLSLLGTGIAIAGKKFGTFAMETASHAERAEIAISTLSGSADTAKKMMAELADFAVKTPFTNQTVTDAAEQLLALGFKAKSVIPIMTAVGDAVAATGGNDVNIKNVIHSLGLMKTQGKVTSRQMLNLTNNNIRAWDFLAKKLHVTTQEVRDMVQRGEVDAQTGISAMVEGMEGAYDGMMYKMGHTVSFVMSNLADAIAVPLQLLRDTDAYDGLTTALEGLVDPLENFVEALQPLMTGMMDQASGAVEWLSGALSDLVVSEKLADGTTRNTLKGLGGFRAIVDLLGGIVISGPALLSFSSATKLVSKFVWTIGGPLQAALIQGRKSLEQFGKKVDFSGIANGMADGMKSGLSKAWQFEKQYLDTMRAGIDEAEQWVWRVIGSLDYLGQNAGGWSTPTAIVQFTQWAKPINDVKAQLAMLADIASRTFGPKFTKLVDGAGKAMKAYANTCLGAFSTFSAGAIGVGSVLLMIGAAVAVAAGAFAAAGGDIGSFATRVSEDLSSLGGMASSAIDGLAAGIQAAIPQLYPAMHKIGEAAMVALVDIGTSLQELGPKLMAASVMIASELGRGLIAAAPMFLAGALQLFSGMVQALALTITNLAPQLPGFVMQLGSALAANLPTLLTSALQLFQALVEAFVLVLPSLLAQIPILIATLGQWLIENAPAILGAATTLFTGIIDAIPVVLPLVLSALGGLILSAIENIPSFLGAMGGAAKQLFESIANAVPKVLDALLRAVGDLLNQAKDKILNFDLSKAGKDFIQGFIDGVGSMGGAIAEAATDIANDALGAIKEALGIASPSKEMRKIGRFTGEGFALGLADMKGDVIARMADLSGAVMAGAENPWRYGGYAPSGGFAGGTVINQSFDTTVVRGDEDLYVAAPIIYRNAMAQAGAYA